MVAAKGKVNVGINQVTEDAQLHRTVGVRNFRVYSDHEKVKADASSIKSARESLVPPSGISGPVNKVGLLATASESKGSSKIVKKIKGKHDSSGPSVNQNVRRKALADVSNFQSSFSRNVAFGGSKPMISVGPGSRTMNLSLRKSSMENIRDTRSTKFGDFHTSRKGDKDLRASSDDQRTNNTKYSVCESVVNNGRRNARDSLVSMRKSLPVLKRVNQADTNNVKKNDVSSEKAKRIGGFPVKVKVCAKVGPQVSIGRNQLWRNRVSDGFITMASRDQANADTRVSSRKYVKPILRAANNATTVRRTSRSKCMPAMNESISVATKSSKKKEETVMSSRLENIPALVSHESTKEESLSDGNGKSSANKSNVIARRKSDRRKSFTSLLMTRSKLFEKHGEVIEEKLPNIDDTFNQLEVAEYVDEIYQYYWVSEAQNLSMANYMSIQTDITPQMRGIVINWLIEVHFKFELMQETLYLMVTLLDRYLSQVQIKKKEIQLVGLTALLLASKYEDFWHPRINDLISISAQSYTRGEMLVMEKLFLKKLNFRLNEPTLYVFMLRFLKAAQSDLKLEHLAFYLIELSLVEYEALKFKPSMLCASAIYVARSTLQMFPAWSPLLAKHARYEVSQIRDCAKMILKFQQAARTARLRVTYEKYMRPDLSAVAAIKPLDKLPL